jgi:hypothetical protein
MNPEQQRARHDAIEKTNDRIDALAAAVDEEVGARIQEIRVLITRLIAAEHAESVQAEQKNQVIHLAARRGIRQNTKSIITLNFHLSEFARMTWRERLRWIVLGTLPEPLADFTGDPEAALFSEPLSELSEKSS